MNIDVILNILFFCEINTVYNISLSNKYFYDICNYNKNCILRNILKKKNYKNNIDLILNKKSFIKDFYKIDNGNIYDNIMYSYELIYYDVIKFFKNHENYENYEKSYDYISKFFKSNCDRKELFLEDSSK